MHFVEKSRDLYQKMLLMVLNKKNKITKIFIEL